ncbi:MAG: activase [Deltaproteobacteria bacterium]|nr:activase [Deltaproteobacteria bacterium]
MRCFGVCVGSTSIGLVGLTREVNGLRTFHAESLNHAGQAGQVLESRLLALAGDLPCTVTGTGRGMAGRLNVETISEPEAVERALNHTLGPRAPVQAVLSLGGETFMAYRVDSRGRVLDVNTGNKCASGTGEFFVQQMGRMGLEPGHAARLDPNVEAYRVSGRCSVFCKSDCTHALNKGIPRNRVVSGLTFMMAEKCLDLLEPFDPANIALVGGCTANPFLVRHLRARFPGLVIPAHARCFEALGAALAGSGRSSAPLPRPLSRPTSSPFVHHPALANAQNLVDFKTMPRARAQTGEELILGLDVGSTTTKGVLLRAADSALVASAYLRTDGAPVDASRRVYAALAGQAPKARVVGLGVTGSGRAIAGLHAGTRAVINEIVAHATAAAHFDPAVDTIFEIGGQDAKYTFVENRVPIDYAMNEACSAGTGSFLEEAARETLGIDMDRIGPMALASTAPPNFSDQCSAFIGSDIKRAIQEGLGIEDIAAGLVCSICLNYLKRVKGNRPVGSTVFMQGGVCYNPAVPVAMALLTGHRVVVPPEPGLMGAFGVALEVMDRLGQGLMAPGSFDIEELAARTVRSRGFFTCRGGREHCDRGCRVERIEVAGTVLPFGGICNRYDGRSSRDANLAGTDRNLVVRRNRILAGTDGDDNPDCPDSTPTVGLNRSFLTHALLPFWRAYFGELGFRVVQPELEHPEGPRRCKAPLCFPAELAHGYARSLLDKRPDFVFLPQIKGLAPIGPGQSCTCVLVQGEPYYLRRAFPELDSLGSRLLSPVLDLGTDLAALAKRLAPVAAILGASANLQKKALETAAQAQADFEVRLNDIGARALADLEARDEFGIILLGRAYSATAPEANKGIPDKIASRGVTVIPMDMLPGRPGPGDETMYWATGRAILAGARLAAEHPGLYPVYVTNFSCGPDSFLTGYFRDIMGNRPSLILELDNHTAHAGIETRIEAFLDVIRHHRRSSRPKTRPRTRVSSRAPELSHPDTVMLVPCLGAWSAPLVASALGLGGLRGQALPPATLEDLELGRAHSTCKECLPLHLTLGAMLNHLRRRSPEERSVFVMADAQGPCRFGQYTVAMNRVLDRLDIQKASIFAPSSVSGYRGLDDRVMLRVWAGIVIGDLFEEMSSMLQAAAMNQDQALALFRDRYETIRQAMTGSRRELRLALRTTARDLAEIPLRRQAQTVPTILLAGEIYVRHDPISRQGLIERLATKGLAVRTAPISEWILYTDWLARQGIECRRGRRFWIRHWAKALVRSSIIKTMAESGLIHADPTPVDRVMAAAASFISPHLTGEAALTVGAILAEMGRPACGAISLGPFGCMPSRLAQAVLAPACTTGALPLDNPARQALGSDHPLPFLCVETDGHPFPQVVEARLEAFVLQARRVHEAIASAPTRS